MRCCQLLIFAIFSCVQAMNITLDALKARYQKPFKHENQTLTVEEYFHYVEDFREDLNFVGKALDSIMMELYSPNFHRNISNDVIGKFKNQFYF